MTLDNHFRDQISRGQPPLIALHNAAQAYADSLQQQGEPKTCRPVAVPAWCRTTLYVRYDELEDTLHSLGRRKCTLKYFDGIVRIVVEPEDAETQNDKPAESAQYADETEAWGNTEPQDSEAVELLREMLQFFDRLSTGTHQMFDVYVWSHRVRNFLEGK